MSSGGDRGRLKALNDYKAFNRAHKKQSISFLDAQARRQRVCESYDDFASILDKFVKIADDAATRNVDCFVVVDIECDYVTPGSNQPDQPFYWHEFFLRQSGLSDDDIAKRRDCQSKLNAEFAKIKNRATKQKRRPQFDTDSRTKGLVKSDIFSLQLACVQDNADTLTTAVHMVKVAETCDGRTMPPAFFRLFSHKSIVWTNVGIEEDLRALNRAFFNDSLIDVRWVDTKSLAESIFGNPMPKLANVQGEGVLGLFQRVFLDKNWTWNKSPAITRSHWWSRQWTDAQIGYALMDVHSIVMVIREILPRLPKTPGQMASLFPLVRDKKATAPAASASFIKDSVTAPFEYNDSSDSENDIIMRWDEPKKSAVVVGKQASVDNKMDDSSSSDEESTSSDDSSSSSSEESVEPAAAAETMDQDEIVEDYRGVLLEECPAIDDEEEVNTRVVDPRASRDVREFDVDVVGKAEFVAPLMSQVGRKLSDRIAKWLRTSVKMNVRSFNKWPNMPMVMATAISGLRRSSAIIRRNINFVLGHFEPKWSEQEKAIFFENVGNAGRLLSPARIIYILKVTEFKIVHLVSLYHEAIFAILSRKPEAAQPFLNLLESLYGKTAAEKLVVFRSYDDNEERAKCFMAATDDAHLVVLCNQIARRFGKKKPAPFRMTHFPSYVAMVARAVDDGVMRFDLAKKIISESVAGDKRTALEALKPYDLLHAHVSHSWGIPTHHPLPPLPPPPFCHDDAFHQVPLKPIKILTQEIASQVAQRLQGEERIFVSVRECNDFAYNASSLGVVGFTAARWEEAFFLFPLSFPSPLQIIAEAIGQKELVCINVKHATHLLGPKFNFVWLGGFRTTRRRNGFFRSAVDNLYEMLDIPLCLNHSRDPLSHPSQIDPVALRHITAELFHMVQADGL